MFKHLKDKLLQTFKTTKKEMSETVRRHSTTLTTAAHGTEEEIREAVLMDIEHDLKSGKMIDKEKLVFYMRERFNQNITDQLTFMLNTEFLKDLIFMPQETIRVNKDDDGNIKDIELTFQDIVLTTPIKLVIPASELNLFLTPTQVEIEELKESK